MPMESICQEDCDQSLYFETAFSRVRMCKVGVKRSGDDVFQDGLFAIVSSNRKGSLFAFWTGYGSLDIFGEHLACLAIAVVARAPTHRFARSLAAP